MRAYGLPRDDDATNPDKADIRLYGRASHVGNLPGKGGDIRAPQKSRSRRAARRRLARQERARVRSAIRAEQAERHIDRVIHTVLRDHKEALDWLASR
jgi:hypothetical protein